ncbi:MAG: peptidylprolyl isomerase [Ignavibacteriales bacterium]|jgi:cyclophilin family peptidyl-prolyl cis-trans isomerase|nr:MAG: peptidylprolyl isomerase [Ignavibacteriales bacterium]
MVIILFTVTNCTEKVEDEQQQIKQETKVNKEERYNYVTIGPDSILVAVVKTNMGTFEMELYPNETPITVTNFVTLAEENFYDSVTFHRIIDGFVIQGGDPTGTGSGGKSIYNGKPYADEFVPSLRHNSAGILSMANRGPSTNTSQFFITLAPTPHLDDRHTVFGKVINGMDVISKIGKVPTDPQFNRPIDPVIMEKVTIERRAKVN